MRVYRVGWLVATAVLTLMGILVAASQSTATLIVVSICFAVFGAVLVLVLRQFGGRRSANGRVRDPLMVAIAVGSSAGGFVGLTELMGLVAVVVVLLVAISSPWAVRAISHWQGWLPCRSNVKLDLVVQALACSGLGTVPFQPLPRAQPVTDKELCKSWCETYETLAGSVSRRMFLRTVERRRACLDELERRHPANFAAWLASGATAAESPLRYFTQGHIDRATINWDELIDGQDL